MHDLPTEWSALCAIVFLFGMRHGSADHLAALDGLVRCWCVGWRLRRRQVSALGRRAT